MKERKNKDEERVRGKKKKCKINKAKNTVSCIIFVLRYGADVIGLLYVYVLHL